MKRALVLDANQRSALAATRSLGLEGLQVFTADCEARTLSGASKFSSGSLQYPNPATSPAAFLSDLEQQVRAQRIDLLMPMTDLTTMLVVEHAERFAPAQLACARSPGYEQLSVKSALIARAAGLGLAVPRSEVVQGRDELLRAASAHAFPVVVKPSRSKYLAGDAIHSTQVQIAHSRAELETIARQAAWLDHIPGVVQQFIPGFGAGIFALGDGNDVVAWFAHRRIREKPPAGGVSVLCESVAPDVAMLEAARRLLRSAAWFGPAMVEFRVAADGTPYLMEVNGRFWGSLQLAIDSGVDFPALLIKLLRGEHITPRADYRTGRRLRWLLGDFDNLLTQLRGHPVSGSRWCALRDFAGSFFDGATRQEVLRWSDPRPGLRESARWLRALV